MTYRFSDEILKLLKIQTTPEVYWPAKEQGYHFGFDYLEEPLWQKYIGLIPVYKYAQCPICGVSCSDPIDTYSTRPILRYSLGHASIYHPNRFRDGPCPHYGGVHSFMNYHGYFPDEVIAVRGYSEVPYVAGQILNGVDEAYAVLHALPVCRIVGDRFEPRYTLFLMTYFAPDLYPIYEKHYEEEYRDNQDDPEFYPYNLVSYNAKFDLAELAKKGVLGWLDYREADLPLVIGEGADLPEIYRDIEGLRKNYYWKRNSLKHRLYKLKRALNWVEE